MKRPILNILFIIISITFIYCSIGFLIYCNLSEREVRGQFGDMSGFANGLFSAFAFGILIYSIWLQRLDLKNQNKTFKLQLEELKNQREELTLQRNEIKLNREELSRTREQHRLNAKASRMQAIEMKNNLKINLHTSKINSLKARIDSIEGMLEALKHGRISRSLSQTRIIRQNLDYCYNQIQSLTNVKLDNLIEEE